MTETVTGHSGSTKRSAAGFRRGKNVPAGLTIERVFTTEGVHPYDEVTWERRDVVQQNWKTGETVFEQRGVEFPDFWSVNASTIVTTKYFRGAVGHRRPRVEPQAAARPGREDLPQGRRGARLLRHPGRRRDVRARAHLAAAAPVLLASTRRSGSTSGPRRRSRCRACFILAVDDSMDSILNWYKEEGFIFKGGSGAGLNLSRIRSSKELLQSSGGTASGPVSFMRGADASAGTIKSGGATRRAAKMVVLDVDHPDIEEFVETKMREEEQDPRAARRRLRHGPRRPRHHLGAVPERQQLGPGHRRVHARGRGEGAEFGLRARLDNAR